MVFSKTSTATASWNGEPRLEGWARVRGFAFVLTAATEAYVVAIATPLIMRARPPRIARLLEPRRSAHPYADRDVATTLRVTDTVLSWGRPLVRTGCLSRGVTRYRMLRRAGADVALCFGAGSVDGAIVAHCWVEREGVALLEPEDVSRFVEMFRICAPGVVVQAA